MCFSRSSYHVCEILWCWFVSRWFFVAQKCSLNASNPVSLNAHANYLSFAYFKFDINILVPILPSIHKSLSYHIDKSLPSTIKRPDRAKMKSNMILLLFFNILFDSVAAIGAVVQRKNQNISIEPEYFHHFVSSNVDISTGTFYIRRTFILVQ